MFAKPIRIAAVALVMLAVTGIAIEADAQCSSCGTAAVASYAPTYSSYYSGSYSASYPATYQTYNSGWYPGYYWNRATARLWGSPNTYVVGYAPSYGVSYQPATVSYAAPACSSCQTVTASYAPACSTCSSGCSTCGVQQVTMRPVCTTACSSPCSTCSTCSSGCSTCSARVVTQTVAQQPPCASCGNGVVQTQAVETTSTHQPDPAPPQTFDGSAVSGQVPNQQSNANAVPSADSSTPEQRVEQKVETNGATEAVQPSPGADETPEYDPYHPSATDDSATFNEAPKLFDPNDRTAQRIQRPVVTAVYTKPAAYRSVSTRPATAEQARQDAIGWASASN